MKETGGAPYFRFYGKAEDLMKKHSDSKMHLSVSHEKNYAVAYAIWEGGEHA